MNTEMQRHLFAPLMRGLLVCLLGSYGLTAAAAAIAITEVEPNNSMVVPATSNAQPVSVPAEGLTISARIGKVDGDLTTDLDFYTFDATEGDTPSIAIVGAQRPDGAGGCLGFPSNIALFDSAGNILAGGMGDCDAQTEALINQSTLPATGKYTVGVSSWTHVFIASGGEVDSADVETPGGPYQLVIGRVRNPVSEAPPPPPPAPSSAKHVPIAVRHWHQDERDLERRRGMWPIAVAILSMADFDAVSVDPVSLTFGATGSEKSLFRCRKNGKDVNRDGRMDTVCYFKPDVANFQTGDLNGVLKGKTKSGQRIEGSAALKIYSVPTHRRGFKHHGRHDSNGDDWKNHKGDHQK